METNIIGELNNLKERDIPTLTVSREKYCKKS